MVARLSVREVGTEESQREESQLRQKSVPSNGGVPNEGYLRLCVGERKKLIITLTVNM